MSMDGFLQWAAENGIALSGASVGKSPFGGYGLFADAKTAADSVVLRIPSHTVYDLETLLQVTAKVHEQDASAAAVVKEVLTAGGNASETVLVRSYVWGLAILGRTQPGLVTSISPYLDVLLNTDTWDVDDTLEDSLGSLSVRADDIEARLRSEKAAVYKDYTKLLAACRPAKALSFQQCFQLHQAVKSRVLEIPHEDPDDPESGDFVTSISLVPVLDFANHSHENTAVFDTDRATGDVVLRLVADVEKGAEITISYSPAANAGHFLQTYGFIPEGPLTFTVPLPLRLVQEVLEETTELYRSRDPETASADANADSFSLPGLVSFLNVEPEIKFRVENDTAEFVAEEFRVPLLFVKQSYWAELDGWGDEDSHGEPIPSGYCIQPENLAAQTACLWDKAADELVSRNAGTAGEKEAQKRSSKKKGTSRWRRLFRPGKSAPVAEQRQEATEPPAQPEEATEPPAQPEEATAGGVASAVARYNQLQKTVVRAMHPIPYAEIEEAVNWALISNFMGPFT